MLGCGAHVRIIALPHVRCACGSVCEKSFWTVCAMCVRAALFRPCDVRSHFSTLCGKTGHKWPKISILFVIFKLVNVYSYIFDAISHHQNPYLDGVNWQNALAKSSTIKKSGKKWKFQNVRVRVRLNFGQNAHKHAMCAPWVFRALK